MDEEFLYVFKLLLRDEESGANKEHIWEFDLESDVRLNDETYFSL